MTDYESFLLGKQARTAAPGLSVPWVCEPDPLFPFQRKIVTIALQRARCAVFAGCGLGKTRMGIAWAHHVRQQTMRPVLILCPLAVATEFMRESEAMRLPIVRVRESSDVLDGAQIYVCNYDRIDRLERLLPLLSGVVLDESSILKSFDGKTRTRLIESFADTPYKLACTATPSPNDHTELGNHAEFLGVMKRQEMLATYFVHDGGSTQDWRLKGHAHDVFWSWVCSWAICLERPSDLDCSDEGYNLPPLTMSEHVVEIGHEATRDAGMLFAYEAVTLSEQRAVRRTTLAQRVAECARLVATEPGHQWLVWCELNDESAALTAAIPGAIEVTGSDSAESKEQALIDFTSGRTRVLVSKASIFGWGCNLQCADRQLFVGASHSFEQTYQAIRRSWRFGQKNEVVAHLVLSSADGPVLRNLKRKEAEHETMLAGMMKAMREIQNPEPAKTPAPTRSEGGRNFLLHHGDCVDVVSAMADSSIDFSVYSPPFASLYTYSDSDRDMGNCRSHEEFLEHYRFLVRELLRVTRPGRLSSVHCMVLPTNKTRDGHIGLTDFPGTIIRAHEEAGWIYHSDVVIWKDPVTAMQRTKAIGLLWKQIKKDSTMSRMGIPDRVLTFRAPGENPAPVAHSESQFPVDLWQKWASPVWDDINPSDTLQYMSAREERDERHICPLQLEVIRRCVHLWSNPHDMVLSPFSGIGSEGHVALREGRRFIGVELKDSYFKQALLNLRASEQENCSLFAPTGQAL